MEDGLQSLSDKAKVSLDSSFQRKHALAHAGVGIQRTYYYYSSYWIPAFAGWNDEIEGDFVIIGRTRMSALQESITICTP